MKRLRILCAAGAAALVLLVGLVAGVAAQDGVGDAAVPNQPAQISAAGAAQVAALQAEKEARTPSQQKLSSHLLLALRRWRNDPLLQALPAVQTLTPDAQGRILVDIALVDEAGLKPVLSALAQMNAVIPYKSASGRTVRALLPLDQTEALAGLPEVHAIRPADQGVTNSQLAATAVWSPDLIDVSEGSATHEIKLAQQLYGVTGAGQKICVLSDGVNSLETAQASGDLPPTVDVLPGQDGFGDEGTAMLEIVHDLAPDAELGFATAMAGTENFADNIRQLQAAGCSIIVDDVSYLSESPFQEDEIAQAVIDVTNAGAMFFSSAANDGNLDSNRSGTWEGDFNANGSLAGLPNGRVHNFGDGGQSDALTSPASTVLLHWNDPAGLAGNDYDLYVMDASLQTVLAASTDAQNGSGIAYEYVTGDFPAGARVVVWRKNGAANRMINVLAWRSTLQLATAGATRGHSAAPLAFSVAAVPAAGALNAGAPTGPYPNPYTTADVVELFSSDGPRRIFFDFAGNWLPGAPAGNYSATGGVLRQKPDITAADGVSTSAPGYSPFFGTSAAAPHAAAIAGLLKQAFPLSSTLQIRNLLEVTALDIMAPGVDRDSGHGIVMPVRALALGGAQARAMLIDAPPVLTEVSGNGDAAIDPLETWRLTIPLTNTGMMNAGAINATVASSTPGVSVTANASAYPNLPPGAAGANAVPFVFQVGSSVTCGATLAFTLTVNYTDTDARTASLPLALVTGAIGSAPLTFPYAGPVVAIPDRASPAITATASLNVAGVPGYVGRLQFRLDGTQCTTNPGATTVGLDHTYVSDLKISLRSPQGKRVSLLAGVGDDGRNFCQTVLDDSAAVAILSTTGQDAPFSGTYRPVEPLAAFAGQVANGTWQLLAVDGSANDTGHIRAFSLQIWPVSCAATPNLPVLSGLAVNTGVLAPAFNPMLTSYTLQVGAAVQSFALTPATIWDGGALYVDGVAVTAGSPIAVALAAGRHREIMLELRTAGGALANSYRVLVNRAPQLAASVESTAPGTPLTVAALAHAADADGDGITLKAATVLTAATGIAAGTPDGSVTYTPAAGFGGLAVLNLQAEDAAGGAATAQAYIVVGKPGEGKPQTLIYDTAQPVTGTLPGANAATITLALEPGAYTETLGVRDIFYLGLTRVLTPAAELATPPPGLSATGQLFTLAGYRNAAALEQVRFGVPPTLALHYAEAAQGSGAAQPGALALYAWDAAAGGWSQDGLVQLAYDEASHTIVYAVDHAATFGFFDQTGAQERLYLPNVRRP